jgi:hypothetical protein
VDVVQTHPFSVEERCLRERTRHLFLAAARAQGDARGILLAEVVELHMGIVDALVASHQGCFLATGDLRRVAFLALVDAVGSFDPARAGEDFRAAAEDAISRRLREHVSSLTGSNDHRWVPPAHVDGTGGARA